ncbi:hypothetical protein CORC01_05486, partial [Colletotrichum orchidophilum]
LALFETQPTSHVRGSRQPSWRRPQRRQPSPTLASLRFAPVATNDTTTSSRFLLLSQERFSARGDRQRHTSDPQKRGYLEKGSARGCGGAT